MTRSAQAGGETMRSGAGLVLFAGLSAAMSLAYVTVSARRLGPRAYGDFWVALSLLYFCTVAINPIGPTVSRIVALLIERDRGHDLSFLRSRVLARLAPALGIALLAVTAWVRPAAGLLRMETSFPLVLAGVTVAVYGVAMLDRGILQGARRFREYNNNTLLESSLRLLCAWLLLTWIEPTATMAMVAYAFALIVAEGALAFRLHRGAPAEEREPLPWNEFGRIGAPIVMLMLALAVYQNVDTFAVKRYCTPGEAGVYGAAAALARTFTVILGPLYVLAVPTLAAVRERGAPVLTAGLRICAAYLALAALPLIAFALAGKTIVTLLYGVAFVDAVRLLLPLSGIVIIGNLALLGGQILATSEHLAPIWLYCAIAMGEVVALGHYQPAIRGVIAIGYVAQCSAAAVVIVALFLTTVRLKRAQIHEAGKG